MVNFETMKIAFSENNHALAVRIERGYATSELISTLDIPPYNGVLLLSGGAKGMSLNGLMTIEKMIESIIKFAIGENFIVIDGGTKAGIMEILGEKHITHHSSVPLIGVCPIDKVVWPGKETHSDLTPLETHHTHFVLTPGNRWGDETITMLSLFSAMSKKAKSAVILINGGSIAKREILLSVQGKHQIIIISGTGRLADEIAAVKTGQNIYPDNELAYIAQNGMISLFDLQNTPDELIKHLRHRLSFSKATYQIRKRGEIMNSVDKFEEYKLFVDDTARFSERRQAVTNTYISVNGAILGFIAFLVKDAALTNWWLVVAVMPVITAGIVACFFWRQMVFKYKSLVKLRMEVLHEMEKNMTGSVKMYHREDVLFPRDSNGMSLGKSLGFSNLEASLPLIFIALYTLFGLGLTLATGLVLAGILPAPVLSP